MRFQYLCSRSRRPLIVGSAVIVTGLAFAAVGPRNAAQSETATEAPAEAPVKAAPKRKPRVVAKAPAATPEPVKSAAKEEPAAPARAGDGKAPYDFAAQLDRAGASACRAQLNALAVSTMGSVETFNTVSSWSQTAGDKRAVSIAIGQKYATGSAVPFGASEVIATPNQQGGCDGFSVQVIPSPLSCTKLRESMTAQRAQQLGELAGIPIMQDSGGGRTMLVPTKADACVLIATRTSYAK